MTSVLTDISHEFYATEIYSQKARFMELKGMSTKGPITTSLGLTLVSAVSILLPVTFVRLRSGEFFNFFEQMSRV